MIERAPNKSFDYMKNTVLNYMMEVVEIQWKMR